MAEADPSPLTGKLGDAVRAVSTALDALGVPAMVIGGVAVIARGVPRFTRDVDATVAGGTLSLNAVLEVFEQHDIEPRIADALAFAETSQVLLLCHRPSGVNVDVSIAWLPFEMDALAALDRVMLLGRSVPVARPEDLVVYKTIAFRPQDQQDLERLLVLYGAQLDLSRIRTIVAELLEAIGETDRLTAFDRLVERAR